MAVSHEKTEEHGGGKEIISGIIDFYNNKRPHMSNGMMTPRQKRESYTKVA